MMSLGAPLALISSRDDCLAWELPPREVPADARRAAERACRDVSAALGLTPPSIRWLSRVVHDCRGITFAGHPSEIWVRWQGEAAAVETTCHELRHLAQIRSCSRLDQHEREDEADRFGAEVRARFEAGLPLADAPKRSAPVPPPRPTPAARATRHRARSEAETAMAARRASLFEVKGRRCWRCDDCGEVTPVNVTHRCRAARGLVPSR